MEIDRRKIVEAIKGPYYIETCHCGVPCNEHYSETHSAVPVNDPDIEMAADRVMAVMKNHQIRSGNSEEEIIGMGWILSGTSGGIDWSEVAFRPINNNLVQPVMQDPIKEDDDDDHDHIVMSLEERLAVIERARDLCWRVAENRRNSRAEYEREAIMLGNMPSYDEMMYTKRNGLMEGWESGYAEVQTRMNNGEYDTDTGYRSAKRWNS